MKQAAASCRGLRGLQASHSKQQAVSPRKEELISCFCVWMKWKCTESGQPTPRGLLYLPQSTLCSHAKYWCFLHGGEL